MAATDFEAAFTALRQLLQICPQRLAVQKDTPEEFSVVGRVPSPFPQHKGNPMWFGAVRTGKTAVSFHLMPLYMSPPLMAMLSPELKKRLQGKTCFGFRNAPDAALLEELRKLTEAAVAQWSEKNWL